MNNLDRSLLKLATKIHEALQKQSHPLPAPIMPAELWQRCISLCRQLDIAQTQGWQAAARRVSEHLQTQLVNLRYELDRLPSPTREASANNTKTSLRDIFEDLLALRKEFAEVWCDRVAHTLTVVTEPITLEGISLGPFDIVLEPQALAQNSTHCYRVVAQDPNAAATDDTVTHPHVQDERLCEGEGRAAIHAALQQGRLLDFFLLVAGALQTYNSGSPYVALRDWHGKLCHDCDSSVNEDYRYSCEFCECDLCDSCVGDCCQCSRSACGDCLTLCAFCSSPVCCNCVEQCVTCHRLACSNCLPHFQRCKNCHATQTQNKASEPSQPAAAVLSPSLVETALPA